MGLVLTCSVGSKGSLTAGADQLKKSCLGIRLFGIVVKEGLVRDLLREVIKERGDPLL